MASSTPSVREEDRRAYLSVAVSFGDEEALRRLGAAVSSLTCPECGASGRQLGAPPQPSRLEGFTPLTKGGTRAILATCDACQARVTLPLVRG